jgi:prefoldin alpha subunit
MEDKQKLAQQKYMELQMMAQQHNQIQKQMQLIQQQIEELNSTKEALDEISKAGIGKEFLVPVSSGVFVKGQIKDTQKIIVNVGSNVAVDKTIPEAKSMVDEQLTEIEQFKRELLSNKLRLESTIEHFQKDLQHLIE